jgi:hypothetical protein
MMVINSFAEQKNALLWLPTQQKWPMKANGLAGSARRIEDNRSHQADWRAP